MREFLSYKSGKFYFYGKFNSPELDSLLIRATILNETICDLPILPELASRIEPAIIYSSISGTAAIEGNPIPEEDVKRIAEGEDVDSYSRKDKQEILNLINAYDLLSKIKSSSTPFRLTEDFICKLHELVTHNIPHEHNKPGRYRDGLVHVGDKAHGGVYTPPKVVDDIRNLMKEFIDWINCSDIVFLNPFVRASLAHYYFCIIHPFWDGNGRTSRLIETVILETSNIKYVPRELSNYYYKHVDDYYIAFSQSLKQKKGPTPFLMFSLKGAIASLTDIKNDIIRFIRVFTLKDYYSQLRKRKRLTRRQYELLSILLDNPILFTLKDLNTKSYFSVLYFKVSTQTARRDLKKLTEAGYLKENEESKYSLNMSVLG